MAKNYFTDEQVREMVKKSEILFEHRNKSYMDKLKALMNLAVEASIGEPLAYGVKFKSGMYGSLYNKENEARDEFINWRHVYGEFEVLPFHKIQELEK